MDKNFERDYHENEKDHFWFKSRRDFLIAHLTEFPKTSSILDVGCSSGQLLCDLRAIGFVNLTGVDISEEAVSISKKNGLNVLLDDAQNFSHDTCYDIIISSDNIEHLQDDKLAMSTWARHLKKGGVLFVMAPAYMSLWSSHDSINHHYRRYDRNEVANLGLKVGLSVVKNSNWNWITLPLIWVQRRLLKLELNKKDSTFEISKLGNRFFMLLMKIDNFVSFHFSVKYGLSQFVIFLK